MWYFELPVWHCKQNKVSEHGVFLFLKLEILTSFSIKAPDTPPPPPTPPHSLPACPWTPSVAPGTTAFKRPHFSVFLAPVQIFFGQYTEGVSQALAVYMNSMTRCPQNVYKHQDLIQHFMVLDLKYNQCVT